MPSSKAGKGSTPDSQSIPRESSNGDLVGSPVGLVDCELLCRRTEAERLPMVECVDGSLLIFLGEGLVTLPEAD